MASILNCQHYKKIDSLTEKVHSLNTKEMKHYPKMSVHIEKRRGGGGERDFLQSDTTKTRNW